MFVICGYGCVCVGGVLWEGCQIFGKYCLSTFF